MSFFKQHFPKEADFATVLSFVFTLFAVTCLLLAVFIYAAYIYTSQYNNNSNNNNNDDSKEYHLAALLHNVNAQMCPLQIGDEFLPQVQEFKYVGVCSQVRGEGSRRSTDGLVLQPQ